MNKNNLYLIRPAIVAAAVLLFVFVAMQFNEEVVWTFSDFVFAAAMILGTGYAYELISRMGNLVYKAGVGLALAATFLMIWANGAVGIIGNEGNAVNLMYLGVIAVGFLGAIMSQLKPQGLANTLFAMAAATVAVPVIAMTVWNPPITTGYVELVTVNAFFVTLFLGSGLLFRQAALQK